jgi:hypothetical protein
MTMATDEMLAQGAVSSWKLVIGRLDKGIGALDEEKMQQRVAPERNRLKYLVGHLTAVHDRMFPMLGLGERLYPQLDEVYLTNADGVLADPLSADELKKAWVEVNGKLTAAFEALTPAEWLEKHGAVSEEDFAKDPSRNRLAVLLSRTNHASFHAGQAVLVK